MYVDVVDDFIEDMGDDAIVYIRGINKGTIKDKLAVSRSKKMAVTWSN